GLRPSIYATFDQLGEPSSYHNLPYDVFGFCVPGVLLVAFGLWLSPVLGRGWLSAGSFALLSVLGASTNAARDPALRSKFRVAGTVEADRAHPLRVQPGGGSGPCGGGAGQTWSAEAGALLDPMRNPDGRIGGVACSGESRIGRHKHCAPRGGHTLVRRYSCVACAGADPGRPAIEGRRRALCRRPGTGPGRCARTPRLSDRHLVPAAAHRPRPGGRWDAGVHARPARSPAPLPRLSAEPAGPLACAGGRPPRVSRQRPPSRGNERL